MGPPADARVLSYGDVVLRESDVATLWPRQWLNDTVIEFWFEFQTQRLRDSQLEESKESLLLIGPAVSFWIQSCGSDEDAAAAVRHLSIPSRQLVLLPVNNNADVEQAHGGSHWSLLIFHRGAGAFFHLDSAGNSNSLSARTLFTRLCSAADIKDAKLEEVKSPMQHNAYDCGMFVVCIAQVVCDSVIKSGSPCPSWPELHESICESVDSDVVAKLRGEIQGLIRSLR